ncbi:MAG: hypothetical protein EZS28_014114 [Streblomastix strix]|uniref:Uncharacterized protein n=1 Tax=Streblomastix strix TaxID=222440 RepID=A0A5J4W615_9EUKA|nr:MAG: hypothetical protein EZS28_014114 [Streblomastix strix]
MFSGMSLKKIKIKIQYNGGKESWIYAKQQIDLSGLYPVYKYTEEKAPLLSSGATSSIFEFGYVVFLDCKNPLATTSAAACPCPTNPTELVSDPRYGTICKEEVEPELQICTAYNTPLDCTCSKSSTGLYPQATCEKEKLCHDLQDKTEIQCPCIDGDERAFCITCTAKDTPSSECKCPKDDEGDYSQEKCEADKPSFDKESTGSVRATLGMIAAAVVFPALVLLV